MKVALLGLISLMVLNAQADNVALDQAKKAGLKKCLPAVEKITNFIVDGGNSGAHSFWNQDNVDTNAFSTAIERNYSDGSVLANVVVAPTTNGKCYVEYEKIFNSEKSCLAYSQGLKDAKYESELNKDIAIFKQGSVTIYLLPNGNQCTVVRKEVISDGNKI